MTVTLPLPAGLVRASVYWMRLDGSGFDPIGGTIANGVITAGIPYLGLAVVGQASATRVIQGVARKTFMSATAIASVPRDLSTVTPQAIVEDAGGNLSSIDAILGSGGTFRIPGVPDGWTYVLHSGNQWLVTSTGAPDLGSVVGGRPDEIPLAQSALADVAVTGLDAWQAGDWLETFSTEANDWEFGIETDFASPDVGATDFSFTMDVDGFNGSFPPNGIQGSLGDTAYLAQLSVATSPTGFAYEAMSRVVQFAPFDLLGGGEVSIGGTMLPAHFDESLAVDFRGSAFLDRVVADGNPRQMSLGVALGVRGEPAYPTGSAQVGLYNANADLLNLDDPRPDMDTGSMSYASPAAAGLLGTWAEVGDVRSGGRVQPSYPGFLPNLAGIPSFISYSAPPAELALPAVLVPPLSMPTNIQVNGQSFFDDLSGIGVTPTMTWSQPAIGTPTWYVLAVHELRPRFSDGRTRILFGVATIVTSSTSFTLLPGMLQAGHTYVFHLSAVQSRGSPDGPFRTALRATAGTPSGNLVP